MNISYVDILVEKVHKERDDFRKIHSIMNSMEVYNNWYKIGFFEEYSNLLTSGYIESEYFEDEIRWLCGFENPLHFLYDKWLKCDGAFNYDWDEMLEWIKIIYKEENK